MDDIAKRKSSFNFWTVVLLSERIGNVEKMITTKTRGSILHRQTDRQTDLNCLNRYFQKAWLPIPAPCLF